MPGDLNREQEIALLNFFAKITAEGDLEKLMSYIVSDVPGLLKVRRCSIYLIPSLVPQYNGELLDDPNLLPVQAKSIKDDFIVLAQTNHPGKQEFIGKIFYTLGSDLTGWVFKTGEILRIKNARDENELSNIDKHLHASVRYVFVEPETNLRRIFPILYLPLRIDSKTIGVLKLHQPFDLEGFSNEDEQIGKIIAQIVSGLIEKIQIVSNQNKKILSLAELGTEKNPEEVYEHVTKSILELLACSKSQLYLRDSTDDKIYLAYENGAPFNKESQPQYRHNEGLIGWIFKTGSSLRIDDLRKYRERIFLSDEILAKISDGIAVDEEDRYLELADNNKNYILSFQRNLPFIGAPVFGTDGTIQGVICAHSLSKSKEKQQRSYQFDETDLQRLKTYASIISLAIQADKTRKGGELLLKISRVDNVETLFKLVADNLPGLIHDTDCFIYRLIKTEEPYLELEATNRNKVDLKYTIGEGKTGFCALSESSIIIDHYGRSSVNQRSIDGKKRWVEESRPDDLVCDLVNDNSNRTGIIRLLNGRQLPPDLQSLFQELANVQIVKKDIGLPSNLLKVYLEMSSRPSYSFIGVPILLEKNKLEGVITVTRPIRRNPFSESDLEFIHALAKAIAQVISILELQNQRKELYITLAHEINTYLTPILADSENLQAEASEIGELSKMASHLFGQVQRLHMMSETILGVVSGKTSGEKFTVHSIYRPLMDAISMFRDEAAEYGCDILDPQAVGPNRFPPVEMRLFELTLAFKNIIHNAIKYSFSPPVDQDRHRYIRVKGKWCEQDQNKYCISIENFGVGITEEEIKKGLIFKPYYRGLLSSDRQRTGSGIGLSFTTQVIEVMHHGKITVKSVPKAGNAYLTTFNIILPVTQE